MASSLNLNDLITRRSDRSGVTELSVTIHELPADAPSSFTPAQDAYTFWYHADQADAVKAAGVRYHEATRERFTVWIEPGRGDIDLLGALATLPESFKGWIVVEVDVPEAPTNLASTRIAAAWITEHLGAESFTANQ